MPLYPALSHYFNLHPPVVMQLTPDELQPYLDELDRIARERKRG